MCTGERVTAQFFARCLLEGRARAPDVAWMGKKPFEAYTVNVVSGDFQTIFLFPKACTNLAQLARMQLKAPCWRAPSLLG